MKTTTLNIDKKTYTFVDKGQGHPIVILHGLFGKFSNWTTVVDEFSPDYRTIIPHLPIQESERRHVTIDSLSKYLATFLEILEIKTCTLIGNSLGGHLALFYALKHKEKVDKMVLAASSGLYENNTLGSTFPRISDYQYVKERMTHVFYNPNVATEDYVKEVFNKLQSISNCLKFLSIARSAKHHNMSKVLPLIETPTLLVWGINDTITPPEVAFEFHRGLKNSSIAFYDKCSHAPMMEQPQKFNQSVAQFLRA